MAKYVDDVEVLKVSETEGYIWHDKETNKTWAVPLNLSGLIAPTLMMLPHRPETPEDKELRREHLRKAIAFAAERNPLAAEELQRVLEKL